MTISTGILALTSISLSAIAQLLMKIGMTRLQSPNDSQGALGVATSPYILAGFAAYGVGAVLWLQVLSKIDLSRAYPLVSLGFVIVAMLSWLVLGEKLPLTRLVGISLIVIGVVLIGRASV
jgi:drug/metabolite transporter (DMT)-like permease